MRAIIVGRHKLSGNEGLEVVRQENINFPATSSEVEDILIPLMEKAVKEKAALVFQMMPGQVAVAIANNTNRHQQNQPKIGVIVNKPGERLAGVEEMFFFEDKKGMEQAKKAVRFANPRAKIKEGGYLSVTVDPPLRFEFSHIEWF